MNSQFQTLQCFLLSPYRVGKSSTEEKSPLYLLSVCNAFSTNIKFVNLVKNDCLLLTSRMQKHSVLETIRLLQSFPGKIIDPNDSKPMK